MAKYFSNLKVVTFVLASAILAAGWWEHGSTVLVAGTAHSVLDKSSGAQWRQQGLPARFRGVDAEKFVPTPLASADSLADPLLTNDLHYTLEALLWQAGSASDPSLLKQHLAELVGRRFPPTLAARAVELSGRYVDYRVALGALRPPQDSTDLQVLRNALKTRQAMRLQFFDDAEYSALFAREDELDRYSLARIEAVRNPRLTPEQRMDALKATEQLLTKERMAERKTAVEHMAVAAQTAVFNARSTDSDTRHAERSARYGEAAAHALAALDREEQYWQQRLDLYSQASSGSSSDLQLLRQQRFTPEELQRLDAALALRELQAIAAATMPRP